MKTKRIIQLFLLVFACCSFYYCYDIGNSKQSGWKSRPLFKTDQYYPDYSFPIESGWDGGALGMGIICASSLLGIVYLEAKF